MDRLRVADAAGLEDLLAFAADLKAHQLRQAALDKDNYTLWHGADGQFLGLRKHTGEYRRIQPCYSWPCWACSNSPFWSTISATNTCLMRWARQVPEQADRIQKCLVNPKHATIAAWLVKEENARRRQLRAQKGQLS